MWNDWDKSDKDGRVKQEGGVECEAIRRNLDDQSSMIRLEEKGESLEVVGLFVR